MIYVVTNERGTHAHHACDSIDTACSKTGWGMTDGRVFSIDIPGGKIREYDTETGFPMDQFATIPDDE